MALALLNPPNVWTLRYDVTYARSEAESLLAAFTSCQSPCLNYSCLKDPFGKMETKQEKVFVS